MGAWGPRSFDNDSAQDWLAELGGIRSLRATLERVVKRKAIAYIDVDDASAVIAAAEVIAAARGHAPKGAPEELSDMSPDGTLRGSVTSMKGMCLVVIEADTGGGGVCAAMCDFDAMTIRWIDDATLEVTHPAKAKLVGERDDSWQFMGRTVAIRYVTP